MKRKPRRGADPIEGRMELALNPGAFIPDRECFSFVSPDIDWTNKEIVINKAVSKTKMSDGVRKWEWRIGPPKSRKSNRRVAAADAVLELLRNLRSKAKDSSGLIFRGPEGKRMAPDYFDAFIFGRIAARAGLSRVRFHDLRHFFASMLIAQGREREIRLRPDGPLQYTGHLRHLWTPLPELTRNSSKEAATGHVYRKK